MTSPRRWSSARTGLFVSPIAIGGDKCLRINFRQAHLYYRLSFSLNQRETVLPLSKPTSSGERDLWVGPLRRGFLLQLGNIIVNPNASIADGVTPVDEYLETVDWATSNPSIRSSPWIRDGPHREFSPLIRWTRPRRPRSIFGRPISRFPTPKRFKTRAMPPQDRLRLDHLGYAEQARPKPGHPYDQRPITAAQSKTRRRLRQSDIELMTKEKVLGFKPPSRLEHVGDEHSKRVQNRKHRSE